MKYECVLAQGRHRRIVNEGDQTFVSFSNRGIGQQQSQGHGAHETDAPICPDEAHALNVVK